MPSAQINQPSNQIKLTNVSLVRLKKGKKRFEVPAYKNVVQSYRAGNETDLDNVLQINNVFINVSKGQVAPNDDLKKSFPGMTREQVVLEILNKGEVQVGEKERTLELDRVRKEVIEIVAGRLVDPKSKRVYTTGMIEKALDQLSSQAGHAGRQVGSKASASGSGEGTPQNRSVSRDQSRGESAAAENTSESASGEAKPATAATEPSKPAWKGVTLMRSGKSQALDAMKALIAHQPIPVVRARMRLRITCPTNLLKKSIEYPPQKLHQNDGDDKPDGVPELATIKDRLLAYMEQVESQDVTGDEWEVVGFAEPGSLRLLYAFSQSCTNSRAKVEVLDMAVTYED